VQRGLSFADLGADWWPSAVAHYHGVTRRRLRRRMRNAADVDVSRANALERLRAVHGVALPDPSARRP
jgi:hypothetical protein